MEQDNEPKQPVVPQFIIPPLRQKLSVNGIPIAQKVCTLYTSSRSMTVLEILNTIEESRRNAEELLASAESLERLLEFATRPTPDFQALAVAAGWEEREKSWRGDTYVRRKSDYYKLCEAQNRYPDRLRDEFETASNWEEACRKDKLCEFYAPTPARHD